MMAITRAKYGGPEVLEWSKVDVRQPGTGEVLVEVKAASINKADVLVMRGEPFLARLAFGLLRPKNRGLGSDFAGVVKSVGPGVTRLKPGDRVYGDLSGSGFGAFAEEVVAPEAVLAVMPAGIPYEQAAAVPMAAATALQALRDKAKVKSGERVLVTGASGGVGSFAVQIAKAFGAHVTAVTSTAEAEAVMSLGADEVIDRFKEDYRKAKAGYDVSIETAAYGTLKELEAVLKPGGRLVLVGGSLGLTAAAAMRGKGMLAKPKREDLETIGKLIEDGSVRPYIGDAFKLRETKDALARFSAGSTSGKVVLSVG